MRNDEFCDYLIQSFHLWNVSECLDYGPTAETRNSALSKYVALR